MRTNTEIYCSDILRRASSVCSEQIVTIKMKCLDGETISFEIFNREKFEINGFPCFKILI